MGWLNLVTTSYYDYPSNFSNGSLSVDGVGNLFMWMNQSLGSSFGGMLLIALAIISFLTMKGSGYPASKSFAATSFVVTLLSVTLMMAGIVSFPIVMLCAIITIFAALVARSEANIGL